MSEPSLNRIQGGAIAFLLPSLAHGGAQKVFLEVVSELHRQGEDVSLLCLDREGELLSRLPGNINVDFLEPRHSFNLIHKRVLQWFMLRNWVRSHKVYTLYSTVTGMNLFVLSCFFFNSRVRVIIREANSLENMQNSLYRVAMKYLFPRAWRIICTSDYLSQQLVPFIHKPEQMVLRPNPIDVSHIKTMADVSPEVSTKPETICILAVGRLVRAKGFDVLITSLSMLPKELRVELILIGDGPEKHTLQQLAVNLEVANKIRFEGYQSNPYRYMKQADLFVLSSRWEGYVNTVIEAMVLNLPIVATDCKSGPTDILKNELGQSLVPVDDPEMLARAIETGIRSIEKIDYSQVLMRHDMHSACRGYIEI